MATIAAMSMTNTALNLSGLACLTYMACVPVANISAAMPEPAPIEAGGVAEATHVPRARDGLFYVWGEVNGTRIRFLVDTGASVTVLTKRDARRAGVRPVSGHGETRMRTASGSTGMRWVRMEKVRLAGSELHDLDAAVMANGPAVSLLGQNMLTKMASIAIDGNQLHLR